MLINLCQHNHEFLMILSRLWYHGFPPMILMSFFLYISWFHPVA